MDLRELSEHMDWTSRFTAAFQSDPRAHRDFSHGFSHLIQFAGILSTEINMRDHYENAGGFDGKGTEKVLAEIVVACMRMANTHPDGPLDLQGALEALIEQRNKDINMYG